MKKKFSRIASLLLAVVMLLPTTVAVSAEGDVSTDTTTGTTKSDTLTATDTITITSVDGTATIYYDGGKTTLQLKTNVTENITWSVPSGSDVVDVDQTGLVTAKKAGTATVRAIYSADVVKSADFTVTVEKRKLSKIEVSGTPNKTYTTGDTFGMGTATVIATYEDGSTKDVTSSCTFSPSEDLRATDTSVKISYTEGDITKTATVSDIKVTDKTVTSISIVSPENGAKFTAGKTIAAGDVSIKVTYSNGEKVTLSAADYSNITFSPTTALTTSDKTLTVSYGGKSATIAIAVSESASSSTTTTTGYYPVISKYPKKTSYTVGEKLDLSGIEVLIYKRSDNTLYKTLTSSNFGSINYTFTSSDVGKTQKTMTIKIDEVAVEIPITGLTITAASSVTGLKKDDYSMIDKEDIELKIGDKLNDDIEWDDIFEWVKIVDGSKNTKIKEDSELDDYPGVSLLLKVAGKTTNADVVEADDLESDGTVRLQLYAKVGSKEITDTSKSIRVYVPVEEAECTVSIYKSNTQSNSYLKETKTFESLKDALEILEEKDDIEDEFGLTFGANYSVRIKLGKDQSYTGTFAPDHENPIVIDLNGHEMKLKSEWINYKYCEDLVVTVTNSDSKNYGTLTYTDLSTSLVVAEGSKLEFSEDHIPMDSDAACMATIYRSSSSTTVIGTKVYEDLRSALSALEDLDEVIEDFEIPTSYEDTFVISIKLGKEQSLSTSFNFAPDYEATITIDLNGNTLKLKSDWIDYEDCEDLVVYVTNSNKDKKGTLTYSDLSTSITLERGDSSLKFEEGKIPGLYSITVSDTTNGRVTTNKASVARGDSVTFTITPSSGYEISTVRVGNRSITTATSGYTVSSSTGVGTYKLDNVTEDVTITVTFKAKSQSSGSSSKSWTNPFTDVSSNSQYYSAVEFVCSEGLFNGMTATKFEPMTTMTRAMFVTVLGRLAGIDPLAYSGSSFTDVSRSDQQISWAAPYIEWAVQKGITVGMGNGKFAPNDPITHQQMYLFMYRYAMFIENESGSLVGISLSGISDAGQIADWAEDGVKFASKNNILITSGGKLTPTDNALRCELAMLLHGFCTKVLDYER